MLQLNNLFVRVKDISFSSFRSQPPRQIPAWIGELAATKLSSSCIQYSQIMHDPPEKVEGAEDCLYLNIYAPLREETQNKGHLPVFFWIHGGAFQFGSGTIFGGKYLLDHDVILVTINYRLGPMGMYHDNLLLLPLRSRVLRTFLKLY